MRACDECLRRTWLLERLSGYLEHERRRALELLSLDDHALIELWQGRAPAGLRHEYEQFIGHHAAASRARARDSRLELICQCDTAYPRRLHDLPAGPAVLHVAGGMDRFLELAAMDPVAIVGTRVATGYGTEVAAMLGRGASVCGLGTVSGMAMGIDAAAHRGAVAGGGRTVAVLPGCATEPYPRRHSRLHGQILEAGGVAVSELGPGSPIRRWTFIARNRIIAALSRLTIVVQGAEGSGALVTASLARQLGRTVGAVPGQVHLAQSAGPHRLLRDGAVLIRDAQDVLDTLFGAGVRELEEVRRVQLTPDQTAVLDAITAGDDTPGRLARAEVTVGDVLATLAELELAGVVRRSAGGRYVPLG